MFETIGVACASGAIGYVFAIMSMHIAEHRGWWRHLEIAAIIPTLFMAVFVFFSVSVLAFIAFI